MFSQKNYARIVGSLLLVLNLFAGISSFASTATIAAGQSVLLSASASGTAPFTYQWYKDGAIVNGATSVGFSISNFQGGNAGVYNAQLANSAGSTMSDNATLTLGTIAPAITTQPLSQTALQGTSVTFTASASGTPAPTCQWLLNGTPVAGATGTTLTIASVQAGDAGNYSFSATNSAGTMTSNSATLIVNPASVAPAITTQPASQNVTAGNSVTFTATASGLPTPASQWTFNGTIIPGATGATLNLTNVQAGSAGSYALVATNSAGSATSISALLTVNPAPIAPTITTQPFSQTVTVGDSVSFSAAASGSPAPAGQWKLNGIAITGATSGTLTLTNVQPGNTGVYTFAATNTAGSVTSNPAILTINLATTAPSITMQPVSQTVTTGISVSFIGSATGLPGPTYQWKFNGVAIAGATGTTLSVASAQPANAGSYSFVASNSAGSATSGSATLTVNPASGNPAITTQPVSQTVSMGASVTFTVVATGTPAPTYQWRKNGKSINRANSAAYTLSSVTVYDGAAYTVTVTNSKGSVLSIPAVLSVKVPESPIVYRVDFNGDGQSDLVWQNSTTKEGGLGLMSGTTIASFVSLGTLPANVQIRGTGDFNGDGNSDLLWQNTANHQCGIWLMSGTAVASSVVMSQTPVEWQICGTGDFNGDGKTDIVWENVLTGECKLWLMNGTTVLSKPGLGTVGPQWQITGTGDFNQDGQSDILWQNNVTGEIRVWLMAGPSVASVVSLGTVTSDWQMTGTGDFNGDLQSDILWQNLLTGACQVWLMNGTTIASTVSLATVSPDWMLRN